MRKKNVSAYPKRFPVPTDKKAWKTHFPEYNPPYFTAESVLENDVTKKPSSKNKRWADPEDIHLAKTRRRFLSYEGAVQFDDKGYPLNPKGRTGIRGRGTLGKWGANFAADPVIIRTNVKTKRSELLVIQRKDNEEWALPGGMMDKGETAIATVRRELKEETGIDLIMSDAKEIYKGFVADPRNTDNSWIETTALYKHLSEHAEKRIHLQAGDDAKKVKWCPLTKRFLNSLYANHREIVKRAILLLQSSEVKKQA